MVGSSEGPQMQTVHFNSDSGTKLVWRFHPSEHAQHAQRNDSEVAVGVITHRCYGKSPVPAVQPFCHTTVTWCPQYVPLLSRQQDRRDWLPSRLSHVCCNWTQGWAHVRSGLGPTLLVGLQ